MLNFLPEKNSMVVCFLKCFVCWKTEIQLTLLIQLGKNKAKTLQRHRQIQLRRIASNMEGFEIFFANSGLLHIGIQILNYLDYPDLYQCLEVPPMKPLVESMLDAAKRVQSIRVEYWIEKEGEAFLRYWPEWILVFNHFTSYRKIPDLIAFVDLLERYEKRLLVRSTFTISISVSPLATSKISTFYDFLSLDILVFRLYTLKYGFRRRKRENVQR